MTMDKAGQLFSIVFLIAVAGDFDGVWPNPVRDIVRVDLLRAVLFHGGGGIPLRLRRDEVAERHRTKPVLLASRAGIHGLLGAADIVDWSGLRAAVRRERRRILAAVVRDAAQNRGCPP